MTTTTKTLWKIDPTHSEVQFKVKHLVISTVTGSFDSFDGKIEADGDDFENAKATFTAEIDSITTNNEDRDQHLKSDDFFNAEKYPQLKFESTTLEKVGNGEYKVNGDLTIRDVTKE
ncbi:YceI family protein, partial [Fodinibius sp.]|uniref:YceI family protein n=1 Tax=Fodinibius sp. TaxID=1872440 RepID=UPI0035688878